MNSAYAKSIEFTGERHSQMGLVKSVEARGMEFYDRLTVTPVPLCVLTGNSIHSKSESTNHLPAFGPELARYPCHYLKVVPFRTFPFLVSSECLLSTVTLPVLEGVDGMCATLLVCFFSLYS